MTLERLARRLGLSKTTVSRALAGYADVSEATRARVLEAAKTLGYAPNPIARGLRSGKTGQIGVVVPSSCGGANSPFFLDLLISASRALAQHEFSLVLVSAPPGEEEARELARLVERRRVEALIVAQCRRHDARVTYLLEQGVPFVCHGRTEERRPYAFVDLDGEAAFAMASERLLDLGHRRIAYIGTPSDRYTYSWHRKRGYLRRVQAAGQVPDPDLILEGEGGEDFGRRATRVLLQHAHPPTAILCATDLEAVGALHAIGAAGLRAGHDVSVIGHDDLPLSRHTDPPLTTISQAYDVIGTRLVEMLVELLAGAAPASLQEVWMPELVLRASDGPPPQGRSGTD